MLIAAPVNSQLATEAVRRAIAAGGTGTTAPAAVAAVSAISTQNDGRQGGELLQRLAGRVLPAVVLARLDDTRGIVDIAGERYSVAARLPESGQSVLLRFAGSANPNAAGAAANNPASGVAGTTQPIAAAAPERAAQVVLGSLAQKLSEVAATDARPLNLGPVAASVQAVPAFAAALGALVRDSGMFYESHVARWSRGQYPLARLQREPQAVSAATSGAVATAATNHGSDGVARTSMAAPAQAMLIATELQPIVREQLDLLEQRGLCVMIEAWPGQAVQVEIRQRIDEDQERQGTPDAAGGEPVWATRLALDLTHLGRLEVQIGLAGDRLRLVIQAAPAAAQRLGADTSHLSEALAAVGIRLAGLRIPP